MVDGERHPDIDERAQSGVEQAEREQTSAHRDHVRCLQQRVNGCVGQPSMSGLTGGEPNVKSTEMRRSASHRQREQRHRRVDTTLDAVEHNPGRA